MSTYSPVRIANADQLLEQGLRDGLFTHAVYALALGGETVAHTAFGEATTQSVFDLASLTKPVATATGILQLAEQGTLHLQQPVTHWFEDEFGPLPHLAVIQIRHLLTHVSGMPAIPNWPADGENKARTACLRTALSSMPMSLPGEAYLYSDTGYILLGEIIARVAGTTLAEYFRTEIAAPLSLINTGYLPGPQLEVVPTTGDRLAGQVHDPRAYDMGGEAGHAGLFGTAADILAFAESVRNGGHPILSRAATARVSVSQIQSGIGGQSFGWFCAGNAFLPSGDLFSDRAYGHSGFTGTLLLIDPVYDMSLVLLTNRVTNENEDGMRYLHLRHLWLNAAAASIL